VVDVTRVPPVVLRPGGLELGALRAVIPAVAPAPHQVTDQDTHEPRTAPGLSRRHYAPRATLHITERGRLAALVRDAQPPVGLVTLGASLGLAGVREHTLPADPVGYAAALFAALHALDDAGCRTVVLEAVPDAPGWEAVRDRLARASAAG
jgi:L-threonylcarbamoyladenylate synthase